MRQHFDNLLTDYYRDLAKYLLNTTLRESERAPAAHTLQAIQVMREPSFADPVKLNRWLGFVQGVMFTSGLRTVDQMRAETRGTVAAELVLMTKEAVVKRML